MSLKLRSILAGNTGNVFMQYEPSRGGLVVFTTWLTHESARCMIGYRANGQRPMGIWKQKNNK